MKGMSLRDKMAVPYHLVQGVLAGMRWGWPAKGLKVIGVTGTNGKTTSSFMIWKMLNESGRKCGVMSTVAWGVDKLHEQKEHMTTVSSRLLNRRIAEIKRAGAEYLVLEMTSHALVQHRAVGVPIDIAVMTNVTHEHLDYHKTFENYVAAKCKLFERAKYGVVNADDHSAKKFKLAVDSTRLAHFGFFPAVRARSMSNTTRLRSSEENSNCAQTHRIQNYVTYGIDKGELRAEKVELKADGVEYEVSGMKIRTRIPGVFNVYNSLAAVGVGLKLGLSAGEIEKGIYALDSVEGRMVRVELGQDFAVVIDYAHTPDAFEKLLPNMKEATKGRLIVMFGSAGGRRDPSKREPMGKIAGKYADVVILTEEDDRDTPGEEILEQIAVGARKSGKRDGADLFKELSRPQAMGLAVGMAKKGDTVLFLGKGNEKTIERADGEHEYYEETEVRKALRKVLGEVIK